MLLQVYVRVDEEGTEAAAVTVAQATGSAPGVPPPVPKLVSVANTLCCAHIMESCWAVILPRSELHTLHAHVTCMHGTRTQHAPIVLFYYLAC